MMLLSDLYKIKTVIIKPLETAVSRNLKNREVLINLAIISKAAMGYSNLGR